MEPRPARSFPFFSFLEWLLKQLAAQPPVSDGYTSDACFPSARNGDTNQRFGTGLERDAKEGHTLRQDGACPEVRPSQHTHERVLHMDTAEPSQLRVILDSGASHHAVGEMSLLSSFTAATTPPAGSAAAVAYRARDGRQLPVLGSGSVSRDSFQLHNVLYVPDLHDKLILVSVPQLAGRGCLVMLGAGQCYVKDQGSGEILGKGRLHDDDALYHLEFLKIPRDKAD